MADDLIYVLQDQAEQWNGFSVARWLTKSADALARKDAEIAELRDLLEELEYNRDALKVAHAQLAALRERIEKAHVTYTYVENMDDGSKLVWLGDSTLPENYEGKRVALVALEE